MDLDPRFSYRQLIRAARGENVRIPWLFAFIRHVEEGHYWTWKPRSATFIRKPDTIRQTHGIWRRTRLANAEDNIRVGLDVIEAWFGGY